MIGEKDWEIFRFSNPEEHCNIPSGIILLAYRGSIAHGMYIPNDDPGSIDDVDLIGAVVPDKSHYIGLKQWGSRGTKEHLEGQYDAVFYEIKKLVSLLLQGNPNVLSLLWTNPEHVLYRAEAGTRLLLNRSLFVGKHVYKPFAGYASAQFAKMESRDPAELREYIGVTAELKARGAHPNHKGDEIIDLDRDMQYGAWATEKLIQRLRSYQKKGENIGYMGDKRKRLVLEHGYDSKNAAHLIRLLRMAKEFLETGELQVFRKDANELLAIKMGKWKLSEIKEHAEVLFQEVKQARDRSTLPEKPDYSGVEEVLMRIIMAEALK